MQQQTFTDIEYSRRKKKTRREEFLDTIYDSYAMRSFMHLDFYKEQVPDATTLLKFRHLLEEHHIGEQIFADVSSSLEKAGLIMHGGTIVDATIINAPSSTNLSGGL